MTDQLQKFPKTEVNSTQPDFNKGANLAYWGNMPALYSENATSWPEWMHYIEGWVQDVFTQLVTGLSDTQDNLNGTVTNLNIILADWQTIIDSIPEKIRQYVIDLSTPMIQEQITAYVNATLPDYVGDLFDQKISNYFDSSSSAPETFPTLADLQSKYPTGKNGLFITADNGHKYYYYNGAWIDGGLWQSIVLNDRDVKSNNVDFINFENIKDNLFLNEFDKWNNSGSIIQQVGDTINFTGVSNTDSGILIKVLMRSALPDNQNIYLNLDFITSRIGDVGKDNVSFYIFDKDKNFLNNKRVPFASDKQSATKKHVFAKTNNAFYGVPIPETFYLLVSTQTDYTLTMTDVFINKTSNHTDFVNELSSLSTDKMTNGLVDLTYYNKWNAGASDTYKQLVDGSLLVKRASTSGNSGISYDVQFDVNNDLYISVEMTGSNAAVWVATTGDGLRYGLDSKFTVVDNKDFKVFKVTSQQLKQAAGITNNTLRILIAFGNSFVNIKSLAVSQQSGFSKNKETVNAIMENTGARNRNYIGQTTENIPNLPNVNYSGLMFGGYARTNQIDGLIKNLKVYVPADGTYKFKIANLDQYRLIVNNTDFSLSLKAGLNVLDLEKSGYTILKNQMLLMDLSVAGTFTPDSVGIYEPTILQDAAHTINQDGHSGNNLFSATTIVPFSYSVIEDTSITKIRKLNDNISIINDELDSLSSLKNGVFLTSPNGSKYKLIVNNDGTLSTINSIPKKVLIMGNSLTLEKGGIGMAASDGNHDYYQLIKNYILNANPTATISDRTSFAVWEMAENTANRDTLFNDRIKPLLAPDTDLVIVQLGDNVNTDARHVTFANDVDKLMKNIRSVSPNATIIWVAAWFISFPNLVDEIKAGVTANGGVVADVTEYRNVVANQSFIGATRTGLDGVAFQVTSQGEASHPGDTGMIKIAQKIETLFEF